VNLWSLNLFIVSQECFLGSLPTIHELTLGLHIIREGRISPSVMLMNEGENHECLVAGTLHTKRKDRECQLTNIHDQENISFLKDGPGLTVNAGPISKRLGKGPAFNWRPGDILRKDITVLIQS
jgi:hypothetical protein